MAFSRKTRKTCSEVLPVVSQQWGVNRSSWLFDMEIEFKARCGALGCCQERMFAIFLSCKSAFCPHSDVWPGTFKKIVVQLQLSQFFPSCSPPTTPHSLSQSLPCCPLPWVLYTCSLTRPFPFFPMLPLSPSPLVTGHFVPYFLWTESIEPPVRPPVPQVTSAPGNNREPTRWLCYYLDFINVGSISFLLTQI